MTRLEERYRRLLHLLPKSYRDVWEEDMVSTFLASATPEEGDDADLIADFGRPSWSEVGSVVALAIRLRVGSAGAPPRYAAWSGAIRLAVLAGMLVNAAASMVGVVMTLWLAGMIPLVPVPMNLQPSQYPDSWHRISLFSSISGLLWLAAFLALVWGRLPAARWLGSAAAVAALASTAALAVSGQWILGEVAYTLLLNIFLVLGLAAWHRGAEPVSRRPWLVALGVGTAIVAGHVGLLSQLPLPPLDWAGLLSVALLAAVVAHLALRFLRRPAGFSAWTPALTIIAFGVLGQRLVSLLDYARFGSGGWHPATVTIGVAEALSVGAVAIMLVLLSTRTLRRLPATPADATAWSTSTR